MASLLCSLLRMYIIKYIDAQDCIPLMFYVLKDLNIRFSQFLYDSPNYLKLCVKQSSVCQ